MVSSTQLYVALYNTTGSSSSSGQEFGSPSKVLDLTEDEKDLVTSPTTRRSKQHVKDEEEKDRLQRTQETKEWFNANRVTHKMNIYNAQQGKAVVDVDMLVHPEQCIEARVRKEDIQLRVYQSMKKLGVGRYDIVVLIWNEDLDDLDLTLDKIPLSAKDSKLRFQVICGDHTTGGVQRLHRENPDDPQYKTVSVEVIMCARTQENVRLAYNMGRLDNELKEMTSGTTAWDIVVKIHNVYVDTQAKQISVKMKKTILDKEYAEIYKGVSSTYSKNTFGVMRVLGGKTGKLWDNIEKLFSIPVKKKVPKGHSKPVAPSVGHFYHMADIPEAKLIQWSDRFFQYSEPWNSLMFKKRCDSYKKEQRVKTQIREFVNIIQPDCNASNWSELVEKYPLFGSDERVDQWISMIDDKAKAVLVSHVKVAIKSAVEAHNKSVLTPALENRVDVLFNLYWMLSALSTFCHFLAIFMFDDKKSFSKIFSLSASQKIFEKDFHCFLFF